MGGTARQCGTLSETYVQKVNGTEEIWECTWVTEPPFFFPQTDQRKIPWIREKSQHLCMEFVSERKNGCDTVIDDGTRNTHVPYGIERMSSRDMTITTCRLCIISDRLWFRCRCDERLEHKTEGSKRIFLWSVWVKKKGGSVFDPVSIWRHGNSTRGSRFMIREKYQRALMWNYAPVSRSSDSMRDPVLQCPTQATGCISTA
jgi:hypothetical protein